MSSSKVPRIPCSKTTAQRSHSAGGVTVLNCVSCQEIRPMLHDLGRQSRFVIFCLCLTDERIWGLLGKVD